MGMEHPTTPLQPSKALSFLTQAVNQYTPQSVFPYFLFGKVSLIPPGLMLPFPQLPGLPEPDPAPPSQGGPLHPLPGSHRRW